MTPVTIRPAATLLLIRDTPHGPEVFMQRRAPAAAFLGGAYVFPGGTLEAADADPRIAQRIVGLTAAQANERLALADGALSFWVAAVRECFEEAGIVLARDAEDAPIAPAHLARVTADRAAVNRGELTFAELIARHELLLPAHEILYHDHWITPGGRPRRFDTRFFLAGAPPGQDGSNDDDETVHSLWLRPAIALKRAERNELRIANVTCAVLQELAAFATVDEALARTRAKGPIAATRPVLAQRADGEAIFRHHDVPYAEVRWSDPDETGQTNCELVPGLPKALDRFVTRVVAPNPGAMTGPGTNTYLVGTDELAVIDPGPAMASHVEAIAACGAGRIRWILCTHTHRDHSPAAAALQAATGARIIGLPAPAAGTHDQDFAPERQPAHDELLRIAGVTLRVLHTPGHASNHLCFLLEETGMLFAGDHVMQGSTVIINPPDGDMRAYLASLDALLARDIAIIAPGHGYLIGSPHDEIRRIVAHRLRREARVLAALAQHRSATAADLVPDVYADTPVRMHPAAERSLLAHLGEARRRGAGRRSPMDATRSPALAAPGCRAGRGSASRVGGWRRWGAWFSGSRIRGNDAWMRRTDYRYAWHSPTSDPSADECLVTTPLFRSRG